MSDPQLMIVGAPFEWVGSAPLMRSKPIVQDEAGDVYEVSGYPSLETVTMEEVPESWSTTVSCVVDPVPLVKGAEVWALRPHFPFREGALEDLVQSKAVLYGPTTRMPEDVVWVVVEKSDITEQILTDWCDRACEEAIELESKAFGPGEASLHSKALSCASMSFSLCNAPSKSGFYLAILELAGRTEWCAKTTAMIEQSRGFHFLQSAMSAKVNVLAKVYKRRADLLVTMLPVPRGD